MHAPLARRTRPHAPPPPLSIGADSIIHANAGGCARPTGKVLGCTAHSGVGVARLRVRDADYIHDAVRRHRQGRSDPAHLQVRTSPTQNAQCASGSCALLPSAALPIRCGRLNAVRCRVWFEVSSPADVEVCVTASHSASGLSGGRLFGLLALTMACARRWYRRATHTKLGGIGARAEHPALPVMDLQDPRAASARTRLGGGLLL